MVATINGHDAVKQTVGLEDCMALVNWKYPPRLRTINKYACP